MENGPEKDEYDKQQPQEDLKRIRARAWVIPGGRGSEELWPQFRAELTRLDALPDVSVVDADSGEPVWGVEWLPVDFEGRTVINMVNLLNKPVAVKILRNGRKVTARDLLSLGGRRKVRTLEPITPVLTQLEKP